MVREKDCELTHCERERAAELSFCSHLLTISVFWIKHERTSAEPIMFNKIDT